uniref:Small ribosomal subunit protein uS8 n=1 Tax=Chlamydiales bacterium PN TaxID=1910939 RepID=A0A1K0IT53_9CHLA|nr:30S ribosomal protein S8 [Chlamydiales bacterium PN]
MFTDTIADFLTRIRNGAQARHKYVDVQWSNMNQSLAQILKNAGYIEHFLVKSEGGISTMRVYLRYTKDRTSVIRGIERISTPGRRFYVGYEKMPKIFNGMGMAIVTTSQGVMTGHEARRRKVGGELLCKVW